MLGTHFVHAQSPRWFLGILDISIHYTNLHKASWFERCLPLTTFCVDNDKGAIKAIALCLQEFPMCPSVPAKCYVTDTIFPFEVYRSSWTRQCRQLLSEHYCFWLQNPQRCLTDSITLQCGVNRNFLKWSSMQVTKGTWRMCEQCVPGSLSSSPALHKSLGMRLVLDKLTGSQQRKEDMVLRCNDALMTFRGQESWMQATRVVLWTTSRRMHCVFD